jgi:hypothetical protein
MAHDPRHRVLGEHVLDTRLRVIRIQGDVGGAGLEDAQQPDDEVGGLLHEERDRAFGRHAIVLQPCGQLVRLSLEFSVGEHLGARLHRYRVGCSRRLRGEEVMDACRIFRLSHSWISRSAINAQVLNALYRPIASLTWQMRCANDTGLFRCGEVEDCALTGAVSP